MCERLFPITPLYQVLTSTINILVQNSQCYGILRKPHTDGEFEVYSGFVCVNAQREKSLSGNQANRKWISGEQENREYSVKRISPFEKPAKKVFY